MNAYYFLLTEIGGWHVGCQNERQYAFFVNFALGAGLVDYRWHYAPAIPEGVQAYELTDKGIDAIRHAFGIDAADGAARCRAWYRERTSIAGW